MQCFIHFLMYKDSVGVIVVFHFSGVDFHLWPLDSYERSGAVCSCMEAFVLNNAHIWSSFDLL
jgi:hypothetical protein